VSNKGTIELIESSWKTTQLEDLEVDYLKILGQEFAQNFPLDPIDDELATELRDEENRKTWIRCNRSSSKSAWRLLVPEAIGVIGTSQHDIIVQPKINFQHFMHIAKHSIGSPQIVNSEVSTASSVDFWEVLANWYVTRLEAVLAFELYRDYRAESANLRLIRGTIKPVESTLNWLAGRPEMACEFEEFDSDNSLNRTLNEALLRIADSRFISDPALKRRARTAAHEFSQVSSFSPADLHVQLDRSAEIWQPTFNLASRIIRATGESISSGVHSGQSFLFRTPILMEDGLREILSQHLAGFVKVSKRSMKLIPETMSANPDLVIDEDGQALKSPPILLNDGFAVGDVKYKLSDGKWGRADLAQLVFFSAAYGSSAGFLINFKTASEVNPAPNAIVGGVPYKMINWDTTLADPHEAELNFVSDVRAWIETLINGNQSGRHLTAI